MPRRMLRQRFAAGRAPRRCSNVFIFTKVSASSSRLGRQLHDTAFSATTRAAFPFTLASLIERRWVGKKSDAQTPVHSLRALAAVPAASRRSGFSSASSPPACSSRAKQSRIRLILLRMSARVSSRRTCASPCAAAAMSRRHDPASRRPGALRRGGAEPRRARLGARAPQGIRGGGLQRRGAGLRAPRLRGGDADAPRLRRDRRRIRRGRRPVPQSRLPARRERRGRGRHGRLRVRAHAALRRRLAHDPRRPVGRRHRFHLSPPPRASRRAWSRCSRSPPAAAATPSCVPACRARSKPVARVFDELGKIREGAGAVPLRRERPVFQPETTRLWYERFTAGGRARGVRAAARVRQGRPLYLRRHSSACAAGCRRWSASSRRTASRSSAWTRLPNRCSPSCRSSRAIPAVRCTAPSWKRQRREPTQSAGRPLRVRRRHGRRDRRRVARVQDALWWELRALRGRQRSGVEVRPAADSARRPAQGRRLYGLPLITADRRKRKGALGPFVFEVPAARAARPEEEEEAGPPDGEASFGRSGGLWRAPAEKNLAHARAELQHAVEGLVPALRRPRNTRHSGLAGAREATVPLRARKEHWSLRMAHPLGRAA